jgi:uncharacterized damage-inducible protein DinB
MDTMTTHQQLFVTMALSAWESTLKHTSKIFDSLSDEQMLKEVAPGRNRAIYLLGHLVAVNDGMLKILGFGEKKYPQLETTFLTNPDNPGIPMPTVQELRTYWKDSISLLNSHFSKMLPEDWFARHTAVSEADFEKEPHRNKLNVLINRTNHQEYHRGQLIFLMPAAGDQ